MKISVNDIIQSSFAVNSEDGEKLLEVLKKSNLDDLIVSFENIEHLSTLMGDEYDDLVDAAKMAL